MNEAEFRERYAAAQERVSVSDELKKQVVEAARSVTGEEASACGGASRRGTPARRWALPAAACLVAGALAVGGIPAIAAWVEGAGLGTAGTGAASPATTAASTSGFSVRAYAADGTPMLSFGNDGTVVFDRAEPLQDLDSDYATAGLFTGCLFRVEGEGIARVQMHVTGGALYRYSVETFRTGDEPERVSELLAWKPCVRGSGTLYGMYDNVDILPWPAGTSVKGNPDAEWRVGLSKLYGATVDVSAADDPGIAAGETAFGLWTNEGDAADLAAAESPLAAVMGLFDGQTLTVTVTFEDGRTSTQVIELHAADFRCEPNPDNPAELVLVPETADPSASAQGKDSVHSLYGTVAEAGSGAFPYPLDDANSLAGTVLPATDPLAR